MDNVELKAVMSKWRDAVEARLDSLCKPQDGSPYHSSFEPIRYSLLDAGKRVRPMLAMEFCAAAGGNPADALDCACAVEMIHSYSLIHDDLPCMDDDDFRRGKPSCHKQYGEAFALLAGDSLQMLAFDTIARCDRVPADRLIRVCAELARQAGAEGMVGGQVVDLESEGKAVGEERLEVLVSGKTCALIEAACVIGCIVAGASEDMISCARSYAHGIGMAFQIVDDILDVIGDADVLGKPIASDAENEKSTYVSLLGIEGAKALAEKYTSDAVAALEVFNNADFLRSFAFYLLDRIN
ncbi:MAG: polyprenyl synthetase family protein [Clostridia bacterium]|nr:polyprenyl synthetase family protein [Clostridia bacterium]